MEKRVFSLAMMSASVANFSLVKHALENNLDLNPAWGVPYEFLNYESSSGEILELSLEGKSDAALILPSQEYTLGPFSVSLGVLKHNSSALYEETGTYYEISASVATENFDLVDTDRKRAVVTFLVDISGSMNSSVDGALTENEGNLSLLDLVIYALENFLEKSAANDSIQVGDVFNLVVFNHDAEILVSGAMAEEPTDVSCEAITLNCIFPSLNNLLTQIKSMQPNGTTNLDAGITKAYQVTVSQYDSTKTNRVIIFTDAYANVGEVNVDTISQKVTVNDSEGIYFSGVGIGSGFNFAFLDELTDAGKGSYFAMFGVEDAKNLFSENFAKLIHVAARDVVFELVFPEELERVATASEESSVNKDDVQTTNFSYGTSQFFIETFRQETTGDLDMTKQVSLNIYYKETALSSDETKKTLSLPLSDLLEDITSVTKIVDEQVSPTATSLPILNAIFIRNFASLVADELSCQELKTFHTQLLGSSNITPSASSFSLLNDYQGKVNTVCAE